MQWINRDASTYLTLRAISCNCYVLACIGPWVDRCVQVTLYLCPVFNQCVIHLFDKVTRKTHLVGIQENASQNTLVVRRFGC